MRILVFVVFAFMGMLASRAAYTAVKVHDVASRFLEAWDQSDGRPDQVRLRMLQAALIAEWPGYYRKKFLDWRLNGKDPDREMQLQMQAFPSIEKKFRRKNVEFSATANRHLQRFSDAFPGFDSDIEIYVVHSLGEMDGGIRVVDGRPTFIFGIDVMAMMHKWKDEGPFFFHELFHVYHRQRNPRADSEELYAGLWGEGLATYVSSLLSPAASRAELLLDNPPDLIARTRQALPFIVEDLLLHLTSVDRQVYERYFYFSSKDPIVPRRAGYAVGYMLFQDLAVKHELNELVDMRPSQYLPVVRMWLQGLKKRLQVQEIALVPGARRL